MGKAAKAAADAKKAAAEAKKIAGQAKKTAEGYMEIGNTYIAKGAEATGKFIEKANEKGEQLDRVVEKLVKKFNGATSPVEENPAPEAVAKKPQQRPGKKGHWKI